MAKKKAIKISLTENEQLAISKFKEGRSVAWIINRLKITASRTTKILKEVK